jgi:predicted nucleic-acid-binding protein
MKITADTNVLVRAAVGDDKAQATKAAIILQEAALVAVTLPVLCEFAWVLSRGYKRSTQDIASAIRSLVNSKNIVTNKPAVEAGLSFLEAGGDFADGVIAYEGQWLGADELVSFDKKAVAILKSQGKAARLL